MLRLYSLRCLNACQQPSPGAPKNVVPALQKLARDGAKVVIFTNESTERLKNESAMGDQLAKKMNRLESFVKRFETLSFVLSLLHCAFLVPGNLPERMWGRARYYHAFA